MADVGSLKQEVQALLDKAKLETKVDAKIETLESILDCCLNKDPSLLAPTFPSLLSLQDVQSKPLELWFATKIEEVCKSHNERTSSQCF